MEKTKKWKKIWVNGCFDILHAGHIELLKFAKSQGDVLYVGIDSDQRVKQLKGESRPINNLHSRMAVMSAIKYVNVVECFHSDEHLEQLLYEIKPDMMVIGAEYREKRIIGAEYCEKITFFEKYKDYSSTNAIEKL